MKIMLSMLAWLYMISTSAVAWCIALLIWFFTLPFDPQKKLLHRFGCLWAFHYIQIIPGWRCSIRGRSLLADEGRYIYAANHQSMVDILVIFGLKKHFKWVSKHTVFFVPFIGWNAKLNDYVGIRRGSGQAMNGMLKDCKKHLGRGSSVFFFPEGTRSADGQLAKFKAGPFRLAVETSTPIVPIVIEGTRDILEKNSWRLPVWKQVHISVDILQPIDPALADNDVTKLQALVRDEIAEKLATIRAT